MNSQQPIETNWIPRARPLQHTVSIIKLLTASAPPHVDNQTNPRCNIPGVNGFAPSREEISSFRFLHSFSLFLSSSVTPDGFLAQENVYSARILRILK